MIFAADKRSTGTVHLSTGSEASAFSGIVRSIPTARLAQGDHPTPNNNDNCVVIDKQNQLLTSYTYS